MTESLKKIVYLSQSRYNSMKAEGLLDESVIYLTPATASSEGGGGGTVNVDGATISQDASGVITTIGIKTKSDAIKYDWVGTLEEWETGRANQTIPDDWFCYIIDDGTPVVSVEDVNTYATLEYVLTSIEQEVGPIETDLASYKTTTNASILVLQNADTALEARVSALETAFGETVDQINGEVI